MTTVKTYRMDDFTLALIKELGGDLKLNNTDVIKLAVEKYALEKLGHEKTKDLFFELKERSYNA